MLTRRLLGCVTGLLITVATPARADIVTDGANGPPRLAGRLIVRRVPGVAPPAVAGALAAHGARAVGALGALDATVIEVPEAQLSAVEYQLRATGVFRTVERDYLAHAAELPDDPYFGAQWGLSHVFAPEAWALSTGSGVRVAVIDTGIDASHPDLQGQVLPGYDFVNGDADPFDDHGHGTRMAGIIAAIANNGEGIAGVAPQALLLPVKALDNQGYGAYSDIASGIVYAADQGARVLNLSLSGAVESAVLQDAVDYAIARGALVVAAAGNEGWDFRAYPAAANGAVAVSAINEVDAHPAFSNYGNWIDLAAPGVDIITTSTDHGYASNSGTSPAAAFASAAFALLLAAEPSLSDEAAFDRVRGAAIDLGANGWDKYYGWGLLDAYGALVPDHQPPPADSAAPDVRIVTPTVGSLLSGASTVEVEATDDMAVTRVELFLDRAWYGMATAAPYVFTLDAAALEPGKHRLRAIAYDGVGHAGRSRTVRVLSTTGQGLLVSRAVTTSSRLRMKATFALPDGTRFDPSRDALALTVSETTGTMLELTVAPGTMSGSGRAIKTTVAPSAPAGGTVRLVTKPGRAPGVYVLRVRGSQLTMPPPSLPMDVALTVGGAVLSQSVGEGSP